VLRNAKITLGAAAVGLVGLVAGPLSAANAASEPRNVPPQVQVPAGNEFQFSARARGTQNYTCTGGTWTFTAPEAKLYEHGEYVIHHFAGPTWQDIEDGSAVTAAAVKDAKVSPDPNSIPWLLLKKKTTSGDGRLSDITYIQRLHTRGGLAPTTGCTTTGATLKVPYRAVYAFYAAS